MGVRRGKPRGSVALPLIVAVAVTVAGCGGSGSSSAERTKLAKEISTQLQSGNPPPGLSGCVGRQSLGLPTTQLRDLADAGSNPPQATRQLAYRLIVTCIKHGQGIAAVRSLITKGVLSAAAGTTLPKAFTNCIVSKTNAMTPAQLTQLISAYATENLAAAQSRARQIGVVLAKRCLTAPGVIAAIRPLFLAPIRSGLKTTSAAFRNCVLAKAEALAPAELVRFALDPSLGEKFGAQAGRACIASGAKP